MTSPAARVRAMRQRVRRFWQAPLGDRRGAAGLELGIGTAVVLAVAAVAIDLYSLTKVDTAVARIAVTMADYVSRERAPDGDRMKALGRYLHEHELHAPAHLVFVVSAVRRRPGDVSATIVWEDDTLRYGDQQEVARLSNECGARRSSGWQQTLLGQNGIPTHRNAAGRHHGDRRRRVRPADPPGHAHQPVRLRQHLPHLRGARARQEPEAARDPCLFADGRPHRGTAPFPGRAQRRGSPRSPDAARRNIRGRLIVRGHPGTRRPALPSAKSASARSAGNLSLSHRRTR